MTQPGPPQRQGPRPLPLHLTSAMTVWLSSPLVLRSLSDGSATTAETPLHRDRNLVAAAKALLPPPERRNRAEAAPGPGDRTPPPESEAPGYAALDRAIRQRVDRLLLGIERYRRSDIARDRSGGTILWRRGSTRLRAFGPPTGRPVFMIPSLVNRWTVLDLDGGSSLVDAAIERGMHPLIVDWDRPGPAEAGFDLAAYSKERLEPALAAACRATRRRKLPVLGYCMGGTMAVALAARCPDAVAGLALLAAPWDFHADPVQARQGRALAAALTPFLTALPDDGVLPLDTLQSLFTAADPLLVARKFDKAVDLDPADPRWRAFVLLEDWLNDGVPLTAPVARETLSGWYGSNDPAAGRWRVAGTRIDPATLTVPSLHVIPTADRIVPPASALALAAAMQRAGGAPGGGTPKVRVVRPPLGHIGMMTSRRARTLVWRPVLSWLSRVPIGRRTRRVD